MLTGDRYLEHVISPDHDDIGNVGWWCAIECQPCADRNGRGDLFPQPPVVAHGGGDTPLTAGVSDGGRGPVETPPCLPVPATTHRNNNLKGNP